MGTYEKMLAKANAVVAEWAEARSINDDQNLDDGAWAIAEALRADGIPISDEDVRVCRQVMAATRLTDDDIPY